MERNVKSAPPSSIRLHRRVDELVGFGTNQPIRIVITKGTKGSFASFAIIYFFLIRDLVSKKFNYDFGSKFRGSSSIFSYSFIPDFLIHLFRISLFVIPDFFIRYSGFPYSLYNKGTFAMMKQDLRKKGYVPS